MLLICIGPGRELAFNAVRRRRSSSIVLLRQIALDFRSTSGALRSYEQRGALTCEVAEYVLSDSGIKVSRTKYNSWELVRERRQVSAGRVAGEMY